MKQEMNFENGQNPVSIFALHIIPPLHSNKEHAIALEATMQSLVLDRQHPITLELAGTQEWRSFIVRATSQSALDHVEALLRAQYPQSEIRPLRSHDDPFRLDPGEAVSAVELEAGSASYLPLRSWQEEQKEGTDPLLGLLAALGHLPEHTRAVAQIALTPAVTNWSRWNMRRALESPLAQERRNKERTLLTAILGEGFSNILFIHLVIFIGLFLLLRPAMPPWFLKSIVQICIGRGSQVPASQQGQIILWVCGALLVEGLIIVLSMVVDSWWKRRSMYNPRVVAQKTSRMAYRARLRLYVMGPEMTANDPMSKKAQAQIRKTLLIRMVAAYRQFHMADGAFFVPRRISARAARRLLINRWAGKAEWQKGLRLSRHMIGVDALASLWHMPNPQALPELALVEHRRSRTLLIPPAVTRQCQGLPPIGYSEHAGYRLPFAFTPEFFTFHSLIVGKSGEGKSTFIEHIAQKAMELGGMVLIDPFGDLCENVLQHVPAARAEDVVFIDLSDKLASIGLNPLDVTLGYRRDQFIADLLKMLAQIWAASWNARMENAFEISLRTLFEANKALVARDPQNGPMLQYTLLDILPLLTRANFCHALLQEVEDDYLHRWWREYYEPLSPAQQRDIINPIAAKVAKFENQAARRILGQGISTLHIPQMIKERKIILFKLARGVVGNDVASMIGATLLGLIQNILEDQGYLGYREAPRLPIIINEFQRVAGADYRTLSELHKYGASFFMATQSVDYLQRISPYVWPALQANVRQIVAFNLSAPDAEFLAPELGVDREDILHLDINTCYVSVLAGGRRQPTFSLKLLPPAHVDGIQAESIRTRCRVRYTNPIPEIDQRLSEAMLRNIRLAPVSEPEPSSESPAPPLPRPTLSEKPRERHRERVIQEGEAQYEGAEDVRKKRETFPRMGGPAPDTKESSVLVPDLTKEEQEENELLEMVIRDEIEGEREDLMQREGEREDLIQQQKHNRKTRQH
ncbi:hypothetical protein [Dictyobacter aurantiacus]|uniref:DUF8128 domain-containing protein n=1 Tax=Dictyobacter aurantiacus TaxID=1936993 RepID=A0A401Z9M1_9CHLR|nr:hypothetical protein [Dictyobacter aurantiacus]GCE03496.1 hypothetical protein KDAU_08250 [Dictyobacter aurantiacus]